MGCAKGRQIFAILQKIAQEKKRSHLLHNPLLVFLIFLKLISSFKYVENMECKREMLKENDENRH